MAMQMLTAYWRLFRPAQWLKNVIVFAPLFFGHHFADVPRLMATTVAFIAFCLCASASIASMMHWMLLVMLYIP